MWRIIFRNTWSKHFTKVTVFDYLLSSASYMDKYLPRYSYLYKNPLYNDRNLINRDNIIFECNLQRLNAFWIFIYLQTCIINHVNPISTVLLAKTIPGNAPDIYMKAYATVRCYGNYVAWYLKRLREKAGKILLFLRLL